MLMWTYQKWKMLIFERKINELTAPFYCVGVRVYKNKTVYYLIWLKKKKKKNIFIW